MLSQHAQLPQIEKQERVSVIANSIDIIFFIIKMSKPFF